MEYGLSKTERVATLKRGLTAFKRRGRRDDRRPLQGVVNGFVLGRLNGMVNRNSLIKDHVTNPPFLCLVLMVNTLLLLIPSTRFTRRRRHPRSGTNIPIHR
jgi:hypothetical protein